MNTGEPSHYPWPWWGINPPVVWCPQQFIDPTKRFEELVLRVKELEDELTEAYKRIESLESGDCK